MILICTVTLLFLLWLFQTQLYRFKTSKKISEDIKDLLFKLGKEPLKNNDIPIGAVLIYKRKVIGKGYNNVIKDKCLSGHAEINAINNAYSKLGKQFFELDYKKLILFSTYEPCEMCKGALTHYNIRKVFFIKRKPIKMQLKSTLKEIYYELTKKKIRSLDFQEDLFLMHPEYKKIKNHQ